MTPRFASESRDAIRDAGGHVFIGNLYFGEFLDLPPHTTVIEKAPRVLGITPTSLDKALAVGYAWYQSQPRRQVDYAFEDRLLTAKQT